MLDRPSFSEVLKGMLDYVQGNAEYRLWRKELVPFFDRWLNNKTDTNLWEQIAGDVKDRIGRADCFSLIVSSAASALDEGRIVRHLNRANLQRHSAGMLSLANCAQSLADFYRVRSRYRDIQDKVLQYEEEAQRFRGESKLILELMSWEGAHRQKRGEDLAENTLRLCDHCVPTCAAIFRGRTTKPLRQLQALRIRKRGRSALKMSAPPAEPENSSKNSREFSFTHTTQIMDATPHVQTVRQRHVYTPSAGAPQGR